MSRSGIEEGPDSFYMYITPSQLSLPAGSYTGRGVSYAMVSMGSWAGAGLRYTRVSSSFFLTGIQHYLPWLSQIKT